jgi:hypothetical protein
MCRCNQPNVNGQPGYAWFGDHRDGNGIRPIRAPELREGEEIIFDLPGRCGGMDSHSFHIRLIRNPHSVEELFLAVRHGGGEERFPLKSHGPGEKVLIKCLERLPDDERYWMLLSFYYCVAEAARTASECESAKWKLAAAEKRIKVRRRRGMMYVEIAAPPVISVL